jgi:uncharacterized tellurite resistance protein B-like protein
MDKDDFLGERRHALEEAFFRKVEQQKLVAFRAAMDRASTRQELSAATGIEDAMVLDRLIDLSVSPSTLTALSLAPLLHVAWADGTIQPAEQKAILESARSRGVSESSPSYALLSEWLSHAPDPVLHQAWAAYTRALCQKMSAEQRAALEEQVVAFARGVAEAAGGFLGINKISAAEEQALGAIARAFREA